MNSIAYQICDLGTKVLILLSLLGKLTNNWCTCDRYSIGKSLFIKEPNKILSDGAYWGSQKIFILYWKGFYTPK